MLPDFRAVEGRRPAFVTGGGRPVPAARAAGRRPGSTLQGVIRMQFASATAGGRRASSRAAGERLRSAVGAAARRLQSSLLAAGGRLWPAVGAAGRPRVALLVDGPNVLRDDFDVDLDDVRAAGASLGRPAVTRVYLDEHATPALVQAVEARGFEAVVTSGDVDVRLAVDATALAVEGAVDVLAVVSRDADFKPVLEAAARRGVRTVAVAPGEHGRSAALANAAQESMVLEP